ncbi:hypothetical protein KEM54_000945 [Ascosphaera aggregata]|nr:hypothetical protein KEM54_000945 [Ascosphaera aggregata]
MTTPAGPLHDTDAPLVASVCNIPYTGTSSSEEEEEKEEEEEEEEEEVEVEGGISATTTAKTTSTLSQRHGNPNTLSCDHPRASHIAPLRTALSHDSNDSCDGGNDRDAVSSSSSPSSLTLDEEEIDRRKKIYLRERLKLLDRLFRDVDMLIYLELGALYYMDCSLLRFLIRVFVQLIFFTPKSGTLPSSLPRHPFVGAVFFSNLWILFRHAVAAHPAKPMPESRSYLQGGIFIDFVGVKAPVSRLALVAVDLLVMACQVTMIGIVLEKTVIGKELLKKVRGGTGGDGEEEEEVEEGEEEGEEPGLVVQEGDVIFEIRERMRIPRSDIRSGYGYGSSSSFSGDVETGQTHDSEERGTQETRSSAEIRER